MKNKNLKRLPTTIYKVEDLEQAKVWYSKVFGKTPYHDQPHHVGFNINGDELLLHPEQVPKPKITSTLSYWAVEDITDTYDKMITFGARELDPPGDAGNGTMTALVKDPWNNILGLIKS